ncbi:hypothetical protein NMG60_11008775 [Bertholletia excelsa]
MITGEDVYKVVSAMAPLYLALTLGYGSVKWWGMFTPQQCAAINTFVCYFIFPFFNFEFTAHVNPFTMNYRFLAADVISKAVTAVFLSSCLKLYWTWRKADTSSSKGGDCWGWSITTFSLSTMNNTLVVGVPLLEAMYGPMGSNLVIQASVIQAIVWFPLLLFAFELRQSQNAATAASAAPNTNHLQLADKTHHQIRVDQLDPVLALEADQEHATKDLQGNDTQNTTDTNNNDHTYFDVGADEMVPVNKRRSSFWSSMRVVWVKLAVNPNIYGCIIGLTWACLSNRWHFQMPKIMEASVLVMSRAGTGSAMFGMGLFMAMQEKLIGCGVRQTGLGMLLRFVVAPAATAIGAWAVGLHGNVRRVAILQYSLCVL